MAVFSVSMDGIPPYKQTPANQDERELQHERIVALQNVAHENWQHDPLEGPCWIRVTYVRWQGHPDGANIIGGIADALQTIVLTNDRQLREIFYHEMVGERDRFSVEIGEMIVA